MITSLIQTALMMNPELATWSLMILGFALAGQMLRLARSTAG